MGQISSPSDRRLTLADPTIEGDSPFGVPYTLRQTGRIRLAIEANNQQGLNP